MSEARNASRTAAAVVAVVFGGLLHLVVGWFYLSSGLFVPGYAWLLLMLIWIGFAILLWRVRQQPVAVLLVPLAAAAVWFVAVWVGGELLGWTP